MISVSAGTKIKAKYHVCRKDYIWNPSICLWEWLTLKDL